MANRIINLSLAALVAILAAALINSQDAAQHNHCIEAEIPISLTESIPATFCRDGQGVYQLEIAG